MWKQMKAAAHTIAVVEIGAHLLRSALEGGALQLIAALVIGVYLGRLAGGTARRARREGRKRMRS